MQSDVSIATFYWPNLLQNGISFTTISVISIVLNWQTFVDASFKLFNIGEKIKFTEQNIFTDVRQVSSHSNLNSSIWNHIERHRFECSTFVHFVFKFQNQISFMCDEINTISGSRKKRLEHLDKNQNWCN